MHTRSHTYYRSISEKNIFSPAKASISFSPTKSLSRLREKQTPKATQRNSNDEEQSAFFGYHPGGRPKLKDALAELTPATRVSVRRTEKMADAEGQHSEHKEIKTQNNLFGLHTSSLTAFARSALAPLALDLSSNSEVMLFPNIYMTCFCTFRL